MKEENIQILYWKIGDKFYGSDIKFCMEAQNQFDILKIPHADDFISGVSYLRGDIITALDLPVLIYGKEVEKKIRDVLIRFQLNNRYIAITGDSLPEVIEIEKDMMKSANSYLDNRELKYISNILEIKEGLIFILDVTMLFYIGESLEDNHP